MTEQQHLADTIRRACDGDAWHGPALGEVVEGVDAAMARAKTANAHSIWELALHVTAWFDIVRRRMEGEVLGDHNITTADDWPAAPAELDDKRWEAACEAMLAAGHRLAKSVEEFPGAKLEEIVAAKDYPFSVMLHGIAQHALYHAGQMALIKKQVGGRR